MIKEKYLYERKKFCVPVTKAEPLNSIQFIIDDFMKKKITFCIDGKGETWEIWRLVDDGDSDKIKKTGTPVKPKYLYVEGEEIKEFELA
jgi:CYTH domain-containing protein